MKWKISFILLFSFTLHTVSAQTLTETKELANRYYAMGHFEDALRTYQRVLFFSGNEEKWETYLRMAKCYVATGKIDRSYPYFDLSYFSTDSDSLRKEIAFHKIATLLREKKYGLALTEIYNIHPDGQPYFQDKYDFYLGVAFFGRENYEKSQQHFTALFDSSDKEYLDRLESLFKENKKVSRLNPKLAQAMSLIIPGSGQMYAGDFKNGINSLLLTGGFLYLYVTTTIKTSFLDAFIMVFPWYFRYYMGGFSRTADIVISKKKKRRAEVYQEIILLIYDYKSLKN